MGSIFSSTFPYPMQYLGSKNRIADWILDKSLAEFGTTDVFVDVMAGSGAVSHEANKRGLKLGVNDFQPYSFTVLYSSFEARKEGLKKTIEYLCSGKLEQRLLSGARARYRQLLKQEDQILMTKLSDQDELTRVNLFFKNHRGDPSESTECFDLFSSYYRNTYLGVRQCLEIDALSELAEESANDVAIHIKAALVSAVTYVASTTTHLAQYLKPGSLKQTTNILIKRRCSVVLHVTECLKRAMLYYSQNSAHVTNLPFEQAIPNLSKIGKYPLVYADPPYFKEHYSRYYHLLDTLVLYDYPELTWNSRIGGLTVGLYRKDRLVSDFGLRSKVTGAFKTLIHSTLEVEGNLALSYADTSLLSMDKIIEIANEFDAHVRLMSRGLRHSGQGNKNKNVTEYLFLIGGCR